MGCGDRQIYIDENNSENKIDNPSFDRQNFNCDATSYQMWKNNGGDNLVFDRNTKGFSSVIGYRRMKKYLINANYTSFKATNLTMLRSKKMGHPFSIIYFSFDDNILSKISRIFVQNTSSSLTQETGQETQLEQGPPSELETES